MEQKLSISHWPQLFVLLLLLNSYLIWTVVGAVYKDLMSSKAAHFLGREPLGVKHNLLPRKEAEGLHEMQLDFLCGLFS